MIAPIVWNDRTMGFFDGHCRRDIALAASQVFLFFLGVPEGLQTKGFSWRTSTSCNCDARMIQYIEKMGWYLYRFRGRENRQMQSMKQDRSPQLGEGPRISVIMGVLCGKERRELLQRSVSSILEQSFGDFEFLICDDGSAAEAKALLDGYAEADPRVRLIRPGDKLDLASKLNACLPAARGYYIARMDDDDRALPERFQKQAEALDADPGIAFAGSCVWLVRRGERCGERMLPEYPQVKDFYLTQPFIHPALLFRKAVLEEVGGYSEGKRQVLCEDYDLLLRLYAEH